MNKIILLIIGYVIIFISIVTYYKVNNHRIPFTSRGGYKPDVKMNERIILAFIIQIPLLIFILSNSI